jgi:hypothetical protein
MTFGKPTKNPHSFEPAGFQRGNYMKAMRSFTGKAI